MREIVRNLQKARALISDPQHWLINIMSKLRGEGDYAYCALGAVEKAVGAERYRGSQDCLPEILALDAMIPPGGHDKRSEHGYHYGNHRAALRVANYNNASTHQEVLAWFDSAIEFQKTAPAE